MMCLRYPEEVPTVVADPDEVRPLALSLVLVVELAAVVISASFFLGP